MEVIGIEPPPLRRLSHLAFLMRLSPAERKAVRKSEIDEVSDTMFLFEKAKYIDFDDPVTQGGLQVLVAFGIFDAARLEEITTPPIQSHELP
jgi:hypothetical protein